MLEPESEMKMGARSQVKVQLDDTCKTKHRSTAYVSSKSYS